VVRSERGGAKQDVIGEERSGANDVTAIRQQVIDKERITAAAALVILIRHLNGSIIVARRHTSWPDIGTSFLVSLRLLSSVPLLARRCTPVLLLVVVVVYSSTPLACCIAGNNLSSLHHATSQEDFLPAACFLNGAYSGADFRTRTSRIPSYNPEGYIYQWHPHHGGGSPLAS
jgi:hypothetical protein